MDFNSPIPLIGFSGKAGHGKDLCGELCRKAMLRRGFNFLPMAFAWPLKAAVYGKANDLTLEDVLVTKPPIVRDLLQKEGTELGRNVHGVDLWVRETECLMRLFLGAGVNLIHGFVLTDARFPNEVEFVRTAGGGAPKLTQGMAVWIESDRPTLTGEAALHPSETAFDIFPDKINVFDCIITNNVDTTIEDLQEQMELVVDHYLEKADLRAGAIPLY